MKSHFLVIALSLFIGVQTASSQVKFFEGDYVAALAYAKEVNKPVFLAFYADWCLPCKQMEKYSFSDREFSRMINDNYVALKVNVEYFWGMDVADKFRISVYPTLIVVDSRGREKARAVGFKTEDELKSLVRPLIN